MGWRLRTAEAADADALSLVATATFLETYAGILDGADIVAHCHGKLTPAAFAALIADPDARVTLATHEVGGAPIGYAVTTRCALPLAHDGDVELLRLYVLAAFHGGGLGPALMAQVVAQATAAQGGRLLLGVYHGNARARRFYERSGFAIVGERPFTVGTTTYRDPVYALALWRSPATVTGPGAGP